MEEPTDELTRLAIRYKTDKWGKHHYTPVYNQLFEHKRETVKKVLEIGVAEGAGLRMFRDFFPNATIYGAESDSSRLFAGDRIHVFKCDQSNFVDINRLIKQTGTDFDLIVDDGSHRTEDQLFTCLKIMELADPGVIYIIEDVAKVSIADKIKEKYDCEVLKVGERYDDCLVIVRHKQNG